MSKKNSQPFAVKKPFLALSIMAIASATGGFITACSSVSLPASSTSNTTDAGTKQHMQHGSGMNHSMSMDLGPADANYDLRFIDAMRLHHQGAIAMAKEAEQKSQRREIKLLARNIIITQNREENELLRKWRQAWYPQAPKTPMVYDSNTGKMMPMSSEQKNSMMMKMDLGPANAQFDLRFMNAMIPHHEGAVMMAQDALNKSKRPEINQLAREIAASQQTEINQMKQWRKAWYKQ